VWVKRAELKPVKNSDDLNAANALKVGEQQGAEGDVSNTETSVDDGAQLQLAGSDAGNGLNPEKEKIAHGGSDIHQRQGSYRVQKEATIEPSWENSSKNRNSYAAAVTRDGPKHGGTNNNAAQEVSLHAGLGNNMHGRSEKPQLLLFQLISTREAAENLRLAVHLSSVIFFRPGILHLLQEQQ
jgi:hypothetical protein